MHEGAPMCVRACVRVATFSTFFEEEDMRGASLFKRLDRHQRRNEHRCGGGNELWERLQGQLQAEQLRLQ